MPEVAPRSRTALLVIVAVAAAVVAMVMIAVPAWAASKVFVSDVSPDGGATSVAADSDITATFSRAMKTSSIKGSTFYLREQGSSTAIPATVSYSGTNNTATLDPDSNLEAEATYTATIKGGKRGVKASNGGLLGGTTDSTAAFANRKVTWSFTVADDSPPPPPPPETVVVTPSPLNFTPGTSACNTTITKTVTITNNTATQVDLIPSVTNAHYSVGSDELHIPSGDSLEMSISWTAPNSGFRISDPGRLDLKDAAGNTVATGDLAAFINCGIEG